MPDRLGTGKIRALQNDPQLYYQFQLTPWLAITPDVQYIKPGLLSRQADDAYIFGVRVNMTL